MTPERAAAISSRHPELGALLVRLRDFEVESFMRHYCLDDSPDNHSMLYAKLWKGTSKAIDVEGWRLPKRGRVKGIHGTGVVDSMILLALDEHLHPLAGDANQLRAQYCGVSGWEWRRWRRRYERWVYGSLKDWSDTAARNVSKMQRAG